MVRRLLHRILGRVVSPLALAFALGAGAVLLTSQTALAISDVPPCRPGTLREQLAEVRQKLELSLFLSDRQKAAQQLQVIRILNQARLQKIQGISKVAEDIRKAIQTEDRWATVQKALQKKFDAYPLPWLEWQQLTEDMSREFQRMRADVSSLQKAAPDLSVTELAPLLDLELDAAEELAKAYGVPTRRIHLSTPDSMLKAGARSTLEGLPALELLPTPAQDSANLMLGLSYSQKRGTQVLYSPHALISIGSTAAVLRQGDVLLVDGASMTRGRKSADLMHELVHLREDRSRDRGTPSLDTALLTPAQNGHLLTVSQLRELDQWIRAQKQGSTQERKNLWLDQNTYPKGFRRDELPAHAVGAVTSYLEYRRLLREGRPEEAANQWAVFRSALRFGRQLAVSANHYDRLFATELEDALRNPDLNRAKKPPPLLIGTQDARLFVTLNLSDFTRLDLELPLPSKMGAGQTLKSYTEDATLAALRSMDQRSEAFADVFGAVEEEIQGISDASPRLTPDQEQQLESTLNELWGLVLKGRAQTIHLNGKPPAAGKPTTPPAAR